MADNQSGIHELFSADRAIDTAEADRLDRASFSASLAHAIRAWTGKDSLVVALFGAWGSGKTSIKNMAVETLEDLENPHVLVAEFKAWEFANRNQLTASFFDQIGAALKKGSLGSKKDRRALVVRWRRYSAALERTGDLAEWLERGGSTIAGVAGVLTLGVGLAGIHAATVSGFLLLAVAACLRFASGTAQRVANIFSIGVDAGDEKPIDDIKASISSMLVKLPAPLLIIVDDLDRLTPSETIEMLQLVKANADFPNVVYLLLCDRQVLERQVMTALGVAGRDYLEKIVQLPFDVPTISKNQIQNTLVEGLNALLADDITSKRFDERRWGNIYVGSLHQYFENLRDVHRFVSGLAFHVGLFRSEGSFDVNPVDLIALEAIRVFDPEVYQAIANNKTALTDSIALSMGGAELKAKRLAEIEAIVALTVESRRPMMKELLTQLFPRLSSLFGNTHYLAEWNDTWYRELRVSSTDVFDRYFSLAVSAGDIPQAEIDTIIGASGDRDEIGRRLQALARRDMLQVALRRLEAYKEQIPIENSTAWVTALFDIGDELPDRQPGFFEISSQMHVYRLVNFHLKKDPNEEHRVSVLKDAIIASRSVGLPIDFIAIQESAAARTSENHRELLVDADSVPGLREAALTRIRRAANDGTLGHSSMLAVILYHWRDWADIDEPRAFVSRLSTTPNGPVSLVRAFLKRSQSFGAGDHTVKSNWYITLGEVEKFIDWESVEKTLGDVSMTDLSAEDQRAVSEFRRAVERRRAGKPDYRPDRE
jgi:predicted KAP-like P-loop ATPase